MNWDEDNAVINWTAALCIVMTVGCIEIFALLWLLSKVGVL